MFFVLVFLLNMMQSPYFCKAVSGNNIVIRDRAGYHIYLYNMGTKILSPVDSGHGVGQYVHAYRDLIAYKKVVNGYQKGYIYNLKTKKKVLVYNLSQGGQIGFFENGYFYTDKNLLHVISFNKGQKVYLLKSYANLVSSSREGDLFAYNDDNDQIHLFNARTKTDIVITDNNRAYFQPVVSADRKNILLSSLNGEIYLYSMESGCLRYLSEGADPVFVNDTIIAFLKAKRDLKRLYYSKIYVYNLNSGRQDELLAANRLKIRHIDVQNSIVFFDAYNSDYMYSVNVSGKYYMTVFTNRLYVDSIPQMQGRAGKLITAPYIHQVYDTPDWFNGNAACAPTTAMMVLAYYNKLPYWDTQCSSPYAHTSHYGRYICEIYHFRKYNYNSEADDPSGTPAYGGYGYMWSGSNSPHAVMHIYLQNHDVNSYHLDSPSWTKVSSEIDSGYPYPLCVGLTQAGHLVLTVGRHSDGWHTLIFNDPYGNKNQGYMNYNGQDVYYDWPGYNNGFQNLNAVYWAVGARSAMPPLPDTIVDDASVNQGFYLNTESPSSMKYWWDGLLGYNGHYWWTYTTGASTDTCFALWYANLPYSGFYKVYAYIPDSNASATYAQYTIHNSQGDTTIVINQQDFTSEWALLGEFYFNADSISYVKLGDATGVQGQHIAFDAIYFRNVVNKKEKNHIHTFKDPNTNLFFNSFDFYLNADAGVSIYNSCGRAVFQQKLRSGMHHIGRMLPQGIYYLKIERDSTAERMIKIASP